MKTICLTSTMSRPNRDGRRSKTRSPAPTFSHENEVREAGFGFIAGTDEVGRGCLAGPVVAAAVLLPPGRRIRGVRDSKLLTQADRERLADRISACALSIGFGICSVEEIDRLNILRASLEAMRRALSQLDPSPDFALVDGNQPIHPLPYPQKTLIDGDSLCHAIATASVLAKVERDAIMRRLDDEFPGYGFSEHKGYATKAHINAIATLGPAACHRKSFNLTGKADHHPGLFENA